MPCNHQLVCEYLSDYLDNRLTASLRNRFEQCIAECSQCRHTLEQALQLQQSAARWRDEPVPEWHRTAFAVKPRPRLSYWLNWSALATSTLAIFLVLFQVQIQSNAEGFQVTFGDQTHVRVEALVEKRLAEYRQQQQSLLDARLLAQEEKLGTAQRLAFADLLEKTRDERRSDLNFLVTGIQTQRFEDQQKVDRRLTALVDNQLENNQYINQLIQSANLSKGVKP